MVYEGSAWLILNPDSPRGEDLLLLKCRGEKQESQGCLELGLGAAPCSGGSRFGHSEPSAPGSVSAEDKGKSPTSHMHG